ncbi:hypothetical protein [Plantactinospora sp. GCM10030261]|uniref:hypothetical protein n=1 Tax=Plantactinospora sp. GCM10030261 TaxID=3273420 RepID=UPI0036064DF3
MDPWAIVLLVVVGVGLFTVFSGARGTERARERARLHARLAAVERKVDLVMAHLHVPDVPPEHPEVVRHLERGERIHAVKAYRERTGAGLADAKAAVDRIAEERGLRFK